MYMCTTKTPIQVLDEREKCVIWEGALFIKSKAGAWEAAGHQHWSPDRLEKGCVGDGHAVVNGLRLLWKKTDSRCLQYK